MPSAVGKAFDLRSQISHSRSKAKQRREKTETSFMDSNNNDAPVGKSKGHSKQKAAGPSNSININDLAKAIKKLEYEKENDDELLKGSDSPFTTEILKAHLPKMMKRNFTLRYDRATDPRAHIRDFVSFMALDHISSRATCKYFAITLTSNAKSPGSISSWK